MITRKVLIVDDREENLFSLERILEGVENIEIHKAGSAEEALRLCLYLDFSVAILDVQMPGMDGYELASILREEDRTSNLPIIFLSAVSVENFHIAKGYASGATDYITKPVQAEIIIAKVKVFLQLSDYARNLEQLVGERTLDLAQSEARFRGTFENAAVGIAVLGLDGTFLEVNQLLCGILGYSREEMLARTYEAITHPDDLPINRDLFRKLVRGSIPSYVIEKRYLHREGCWVWVHLTSGVQKDSSGATEYCISLVRDITEERKLTARLELEQNRYKLVSEATGVGVWERNHQTGECYFSPTWKAQIGYEDHELANTGTLLEEHLHPDDKDEIMGKLKTYWKNPTDLDLEFRLRNKDGTYRWIHSVAVPFFDDKGAFLRTIGTHVDVTDAKGRELELLRAKQDAESANEAKSQFLANMSHELRTPLNPIIGLSELLMDGETSPERIQQFVGLIHQAGKHMLDLVNDVLNFARIQTGKSDYSAEWIPVMDAFNDAMQLMQRQAENKGLSFTTDIAISRDQEIHSTLTVLRQITFNLLGNAVKFTKSGGVRVSLELDEEGDGNKRLCLRVADTGCGIPEKDRERIWKAFERVDNSLSSSHTGTGLGLAISKLHAENLGGQIILEESGEAGSVFALILPIKIRKRKENPPLAVNQTGEMSSLRKSALRAIVVEDEDSNRAVAQQMLKRLGCEVILCSSAAEAFEALKQVVPDILFMDLKMPGMDGFQATEQLREHYKGSPPFPIVALTANVTEEARERCRKLGMSGFLTKPLKFKELRETIESLEP